MQTSSKRKPEVLTPPSSPLPSPAPEQKKPISPAKLAANRANAQRSTGPRTAQGKAVSSLNAMKHGLLSRQLLLKSDPIETESAFRSLLNGLTALFAPQGPTETLLVERVAICYWRFARAARFEARSVANAHHAQSDLCTEPPHPRAALTIEATRHILPDPDRLESLVRYEALIGRQLHRALIELNSLQTQRLAASHRPCPHPPLPGSAHRRSGLSAKKQNEPIQTAVFDLANAVSGPNSPQNRTHCEPIS